MKKVFSGLIVAIVAVASVGLVSPSAHAIDVFKNGCDSKTSASTTGGAASSASTGGSNICGASQKDDFATIAKNIINTLLYVVGIVAVVMIIIGGIRYASSNGDSSAIQGAKNTILYAVIGLIVAIMAFAIVNFVVARFAGSGGGSSGNNGGTPATPAQTGTVSGN